MRHIFNITLKNKYKKAIFLSNEINYYLSSNIYIKLYIAKIKNQTNNIIHFITIHKS